MMTVLWYCATSFKCLSTDLPRAPLNFAIDRVDDCEALAVPWAKVDTTPQQIYLKGVRTA